MCLFLEGPGAGCCSFPGWSPAGAAVLSCTSPSVGKGKCLTFCSSHVSELEHLHSANKEGKARRDFLPGLQIKVAVGSFLCCLSLPKPAPLVHSQ